MASRHKQGEPTTKLEHSTKLSSIKGSSRNYVTGKTVCKCVCVCVCVCVCGVCVCVRARAVVGGCTCVSREGCSRKLGIKRIISFQ